MEKHVELFLYISPLFSPEFLQSRVEVPMLGIVTGGAMAFMALLILSLIVLCLMQKNKSKSIGETRARLHAVSKSAGNFDCCMNLQYILQQTNTPPPCMMLQLSQ